MSRSTYPTLFGNSERNSFIKVASSAQGRVAWELELEIFANEAVRGVLVWKGLIVTESLTRFAAFSSDGDCQWVRTKAYGSRTVGTKKGLYYLTAERRLNAIDENNSTVLEDMPLPDTQNSDFPVCAMYPRDDGLVLVRQYVGRIPEKQPFVHASKLDWSGGEPEFAWSREIGGAMTVAPLLIRSEDCLALCCEGKFQFFRARDGMPLKKFRLPDSEVHDWCSDPGGTLYFALRVPAKPEQEERLGLMAISLTDDRTWTWVADAQGRRWVKAQPPVLGIGDNLLCLCDRSALLIQNGKLAWECAPENFSPSFGSSLVDGSFLVASVDRLVRLSFDAETMFDLELGDIVAAPPAAGEDGALYAATSDRLFRIE